MKASLFRDRPARKTRMTMMVAGAMLIHFGIVGLGAMWQQPVTELPKDDVTVFVPGPPDDPGTVFLPVSNNAPVETPDASTPTPAVPVQADPPLSEVVPEMMEPSDATPPPPKPKHAPSRTSSAAATATLPRTTVGTSDAPGGNPGAMTGGPGSGRAGVQGWKTPKPPYPRTVLSSGLQGTTTVRITTDASGSVATVEIVRSTGNAMLDRNTQTYVREFWKGPPNAARTTEFVYQIP